MYFSLPISVICPVDRNVNDEDISLWYLSERDLHLFCKFRMAFTWTRNVEKSSLHDKEFSGYRKK